MKSLTGESFHQIVDRLAEKCIYLTPWILRQFWTSLLCKRQPKFACSRYKYSFRSMWSLHEIFASNSWIELNLQNLCQLNGDMFKAQIFPPVQGGIVIALKAQFNCNWKDLLQSKGDLLEILAWKIYCSSTPNPLSCWNDSWLMLRFHYKNLSPADGKSSQNCSFENCCTPSTKPSSYWKKAQLYYALTTKICLQSTEYLMYIAA